MKKYFAYIRVSTQKQGQTGVSLQEQRDAIERYSRQHDLAISQWFEEQETAAKRGRPVFGQMLKQLRQKKACGIVIHKIDRSARNLKDWADLGELLDAGVDVHFATESLDLSSRGGRLSADIQAVVAADFIRNLREETRKGFYGRLKQGIYPLRAPIGYLDMGKGRPKEPDPERAPLVRHAFEQYATGTYTLHPLLDELSARGLRNRNGNPLSINGLSTLLNNPFYAGLIRIRRTGETFKGCHTPLISMTLFNQVQNILRGKTVQRIRVHAFLFRRMFRCAECNRTMTGERHKEYVYYRCHSRDCRANIVREERIEGAVRDTFEPVQITGDEMQIFAEVLEDCRASWGDRKALLLRSLALQRANVKQREARLIDAYVDQLLDKEAFEARRTQLNTDLVLLDEQVAECQGDGTARFDKIASEFELASRLCSAYFRALDDEKRNILTRVSSNRTVQSKNVAITLRTPYRQLAERPRNADSDLYRDSFRTMMGGCVEICEPKGSTC